MTEFGFSLTYKDEKTRGGVLWESHCHARFELIAVFEGEAILTLEGRRIPLKSGGVIVIPPLVYHTVAVSESARYRRATVLFDPASIPTPIKTAFIERARTGNPLYPTDLTMLQRVSPLAETAFYRPLAESLLVALLYEYTEAVGDEGRDVQDAFLRKTAEYIEAHLCERLSLDEIARHAACSKSSLCHRFHEAMGVTVKQYIIEKRLALASKMMHEGKAPTAVAAAVGYENYSNFYRMYQKRFGAPPSFTKKA